VKDTTRQPTTMPGSEPPPAEVLELPDRCSGRRISSCGSGAQGGSMRSLARATCWPMSSRLGSASSSNGGTRGLRTRVIPRSVGWTRSRVACASVGLGLVRRGPAR